MQEPVDELVATLERVVPGWLERCVTETAERRLGVCPEPLRVRARQMAEAVGPQVVAEVEQLVRADVDNQRGTPLTVLRAAVRHPTDLLAAADIEAPHRDPFAEEHFPADRYDLSPASWSDIDPALHDPGIMWGAWKAATVIHRRRPGGGSPDTPTMT